MGSRRMFFLPAAQDMSPRNEREKESEESSFVETLRNTFLMPSERKRRTEYWAIHNKYGILISEANFSKARS